MSQIGILGGGQLAMMLEEAAPSLGLTLHIMKTGAWQDSIALRDWLSRQTLVTFENEFVDTHLLKEAAHPGVQFAPSLETIELIQDKFHQKTFLKDAGLPVPQFRAVASFEDCVDCARDWGWPIVLKTRRNGYDGKGTFVFREQDGLDGFWQTPPQTPLMAEQFIPFATELAIQVARTADGELVHFPVVETFQSNSICLWTKCPALIPRSDHAAIEKIATTVMTGLKAAGVFAIELFYTANGEIFINELAPRVHNSGHYTIEGCATSQFAQHLRAISEQPLGKTALQYPGVAMLNILGEFDGDCVLQTPKTLKNAALHWYHKTDSRRGRKLGHITAWGDTANAALAAAIEARKEIHLCAK
jgi:5-(carboxyamino)imidazole ribonucleotide synthase